MNGGTPRCIEKAAKSNGIVRRRRRRRRTFKMTHAPVFGARDSRASARRASRNPSASGKRSTRALRIDPLLDMNLVLSSSRKSPPRAARRSPPTEQTASVNRRIVTEFHPVSSRYVSSLSPYIQGGHRETLLKDIKPR